MKFDFDHISFAGMSGVGSEAEGVSAKGAEPSPPTPLTNNSGTTELFDLSSRRDFGHQSISHSYTEKYIDTFLDKTIETSQKGDSITEFYSALKNSKGVLRYALTNDLSNNRSERTLAINKNTADRHGRT